MNFIEEQQRVAKKRLWNRIPFTMNMLKDGNTLIVGDRAVTNIEEELDTLTAQTITNTLNHILESGLLEEREVRSEEKGGYGDHTHNTLARAVKEFMSNMDKV